MRVLPIGDLLDPFMIESYMLYPGLDEQDVEKRKSHFGAELRDIISDGMAMGVMEFPSQWVQHAVEYDRMPNDVLQRMQKGTMVGQMVNFLWALHHHDPSRMSWSNAMKITIKIQHQLGAPKSERHLRDARDQFISVSHLWGAMWNLGFGGAYRRAEGQPKRRRVGMLLQASEVFADFGTSVSPIRSKSEPILPAEKLWRPAHGWMNSFADDTDFAAASDIVVQVPLPDHILSSIKKPGRPAKK